MTIAALASPSGSHARSNSRGPAGVSNVPSYFSICNRSPIAPANWRQYRGFIPDPSSARSLHSDHTFPRNEMHMNAFGSFHPAVGAWFAARFDGPTDAPLDGWDALAAGRDALIAAPTGSGKTLAAFLSSIDSLMKRGLDGCLPDGIDVVYVSPLKALSSDIQRNLEAPLQGIRDAAREMGIAPPDIRTALRTGDTTQAARA